MEADRPRLFVQPIGTIHSPFTEQKGTPALAELRIRNVLFEFPVS
jgi:hypothetical protein